MTKLFKLTTLCALPLLLTQCNKQEKASTSENTKQRGHTRINRESRHQKTSAPRVKPPPLALLLDEVHKAKKSLDTLETAKLTKPESLNQRVKALQRLEKAETAYANAKAQKLGLELSGIDADGTEFALIRFDEKGAPVYYETHNANSAIASNVSMINETTSYGLTGAGLTAGVWDSSAVRKTHQEFQGTSGSRITQTDATATSAHHTHVTGTLGGKGVKAAAKGMASQVKLLNHSFNNDLSEMSAVAARSETSTSSVIVSNHSYGPRTGWYGNQWWGDSATESEDSDFGRYTISCHAVDLLANTAEYYLPVFSCGNDRADGPNAGATVQFRSSYPNGPFVNTIYNPAIHPIAEKAAQYDTIAGRANAKNVLTVGAVRTAVTNGKRNLSIAGQPSFSSWGPADDGRIKPDLVASGVNILSTDDDSDTDYAYNSGTSMASPAVSGSAILLQEHYGNLHNKKLMRSASVKALLIHTADDLGNPGPDYQNGWGHVNALEAVKIISLDKATPSAKHLFESTVTAVATQTDYSFEWDGASPTMKFTLCWTDKAGNAINGLDNATAALVNDLDIRVFTPSGTELKPWVLDRLNPSANATTGDNLVDNVEQIIVSNPETGAYTLRISHKGLEDNLDQHFTLVATGQAGAPLITTPTVAFESFASPNGIVPSTQTLSIFNTTDASTTWSISSDVDWLTFSTTSGTLAGKANTAVNIGFTTAPLSFLKGTHIATISISSPSLTSPIVQTLILQQSGSTRLSQEFNSADNAYPNSDLSNTQLVYIPNGIGYKLVRRTGITALPVEAAAQGNKITLDGTSDAQFIDLRNFPEKFRFYDEAVQTMRIGTNGSIALNGADNDEVFATQYLKNFHFNTQRISALFTKNSYNASATDQSIKYVRIPGDRQVITWNNIPFAGDTTKRSTVQLELFEDGTNLIRVTYLDINSPHYFVGLSDQTAAPPSWPAAAFDFSEADLLPEFTLNVAKNTVNEGESLQVTATLSSPAPLPLTFPINWGGTAVAADFIGRPASVVFAKGESVKGIPTNILADGFDEVDETVTIEVPTNSPLVVSSVNTGSFTIKGLEGPLPYAHWEMDETSGTTAADSSGNHNGTHTGTGIEITNGRSGKGLKITANESYLSVPAIGNAQLNITITGWIYRDGAQTSYSGIFFHRNGSNASGINFGTGNELRYHWSGQHWGWNSGLIVPDKTWCFIALNVQADKAIMYLHNGTSMTSATHPTTHTAADFNSISRIGQDAYSAPRTIRGKVDDFRFYQSNLNSQTLLHKAYRGGLPPAQQYVYDAGFDGADLAADKDPDNDGFGNLLEYALGYAPNIPNPPLSFVQANGKLKLSYPNPQPPGVTLTAEWSENLSEWFTSNLTYTPQGVEMPLDRDRKFLRLRAIQP